MDNVLIVVNDLQAVKAFFIALGLRVEGETRIQGDWVDRVVGLKDVQCTISMLRTPDGHAGVELAKYDSPKPQGSASHNDPVNTFGLRRIMFAVEDLETTLTALRAHGAALVGEVAQYEDVYKLCFVRGPEGVLIGLAEELG